MDTKKAPQKKELILLVTVIEAILLGIAFLWCFLAKINPFNQFFIDFSNMLYGAAGAFVLLGTNYFSLSFLSEHFDFFRRLKEVYGELSVIAVNIDIPSALYLAVISGFTEEFFFRGLLQQEYGIILASVLFGLFHIANAKTLVYGIYAGTVGFYLGWLFIFTGNLLVPVLVHILNNYFAFLHMKKYYQENLIKEST